MSFCPTCHKYPYYYRKSSVVKDRVTTRTESERNKACQRCKFWQIIVLLPILSQIPTLLQKIIRGETAKVWQSLRTNPQVISIFQEGYNLPSKMRPPLTGSPLIIKGYSNPLKNSHLKEALHSLTEKSSGKSHGSVLTGLLLVFVYGSKTKPQVEANLGSKQTELVSQDRNLQDGNPINIKLSSTMDFSNAYFHIPVNPRSRKYLRFHLNGHTYQFRILPFGLATGPLEFIKEVKRVKPMA